MSKGSSSASSQPSAVAFFACGAALSRLLLGMGSLPSSSQPSAAFLAESDAELPRLPVGQGQFLLPAVHRALHGC